MRESFVLSAFLAFLPVAVFAGANEVPVPEEKPARVSFAAADRWTLYADYLPAKAGMPTVLMVHGLGASRAEWQPIEQSLTARGAGYLALDMRCHGESMTGPDGKAVPGWEGCAQSALDPAAGWNYLMLVKKLPAANVIVAGASIGANLTLTACADGMMKPRAMALLSPGLDYRGVKTENAMSRVKGIPVFMAAAYTDGYALNSVRELNKIALKAGSRPMLATPNSGHGVSMFTPDNPDARIMLSALNDFVFSLYKSKAAVKKSAVPEKSPPGAK